MALRFLIFFAIGKTFKAVVKKQEQKTTKNVNIPNPKGGDINIGLQFSDDTELANTILAYIADNKRYLMKDREITKIVFALVKAKIENQSLILTSICCVFLLCI